MSFMGGRGRGFGSGGAGRGSFGVTEGGGFGSSNFQSSNTAVEDDAWDDDAAPAASTKGFGGSNGFGSSSSAGGFGSSNGTSGFGSSNGTSGFGSSNGTSGFGSSNGTSGFGSSNGTSGFGSSNGTNGFGSSNGTNGFGSSSSAGGLGSNFGGGGFGSSGGRFGSSGGGGGSRACHKCGEEGHFARQCPNPGSGGGGGGGRGCHKCGEEGHFARQCPNGGSGGGGGFGSSGGGGGSRACHKCGEEGHFARECPSNTGDPDRPKAEIYVPPELDASEESMFKSIQAGINFDRYDQIPVEISGRSPTGHIDNFSDAGLLETISSNVKKANYFKPTPIQKYAIPAIMAGRDLMGCAQTGSGKTAAFLLPVLTGMINRGLESSAYSPVQEPQALVIAPTRELAIQIYNECRKFSYHTIVRCVRLYGGTSTGHQLRDLEQGAHIIVATPGRLLDFIQRQKISLAKIQYLILDEADRMLDMGFEPEMRRLVDTMGMPPKTERQTLMFSATFPNEIQNLAKDFLNDYLYLTVGQVGGANEDVTQTVLEVTQFEKRDKLMELLREFPNQRTLVFVEQKRNADFLASMLSQSEFTTTSIHGDRLQRERELALSDFKNGVAPVLVATSVAARGLDIAGVDHVVNYDLPKEIDEYVHRIGRTGRCGNTGRATSFYDAEGNGDLARDLVRCLAEAHQIVPEFLQRAADSGGGGGYGGRKKFGNRDIRNGGGDTGGYDEQPGGMMASADGDDEEGWD